MWRKTLLFVQLSLFALAAVAGQVVKVYKLFLISNGTSTVVPLDGSTALSGGIPLVANGSFVLNGDGTPWYVTSPGNAFALSNTATITISGAIYYTQNKYQA